MNSIYSALFSDIIQRRIAENEKNFSQQFTEIEQTFGLLYNLTNISVIAGSIAALETRFNDTSLELFTGNSYVYISKVL